jgi:hypothetical protein
VPGIFYFTVVSAISLLSASVWSAGPCDQPQTDAEVSQCLAIELQKVYAKHSLAHQNLTVALPSTHEADFRNRENVWEKARNAKCKVDIQGPNFSAWLRAVAESPRKITCVIRETREHLTQIEKSPVTQGEQHHDQAPVSKPVTKISDFIWVSSVTRSTGKWYFEVTLDQNGIARTQDGVRGDWPMAMWIGCADTKRRYDIGTLVQIRPGSSQVLETLGLALDLESGKLFISRNGLWQGSVPGSQGGKTIKQGLSYICELDSTVAIQSLLDKNVVNVNLGEAPFRFSLPQKYLPIQKGIFEELGR